MPGMQTEQSADTEAAVAPEQRPAGRGPDLDDLSPAGVLALQRSAGNRVARAAIARRAGHGARVLARDKSLDDQVADLQAKISAAATVTDALKQEAKALATKCWSGKATDADAARAQVRKIVGSLMNNKAQDAGIDIAAATKDGDVERSALAQMGNSSIAGMENYLVQMGRLAGVTIAAPGANQKVTAWLDANTDKIGQALVKLQGQGVTGFKQTDLEQEVIGQMLTVFFRAATDAEGDIKPESLGRLAALGVDASSGEIIADCDVWATYGARLFRAIGWTTVAYLSVVPDEKDPTNPSTDRAAHAVVLVSHASGGSTSYAGVSDFTVKAFSASTEAAARQELLDLALDIYSANGVLKKYRSYYLAAGTGGAYDVRILDPVNKGLTPWKTVP
jgi:post-segregation antitoxin (ccd killing protein)